MTNRSTILEEAVSPKAAVEMLARQGIRVSERAIKEKAFRLGAYRKIGRTIFFLPSDLERIITPELETTTPPSSDLAEARAALQRRKQEKESAASELAALNQVVADLKAGKLGRKSD